MVRSNTQSMNTLNNSLNTLAAEDPPSVRESVISIGDVSLAGLSDINLSKKKQKMVKALVD